MKNEEGFIELKLPGVEETLRILLTPYANEYRLKTFPGFEDPEKELRYVLKEKWNETAADIATIRE